MTSLPPAETAKKIFWVLKIEIVCLRSFCEDVGTFGFRRWEKWLYWAFKVPSQNRALAWFRPLAACVCARDRPSIQATLVATHLHNPIIKTCEAGLVLSVTCILSAALTQFRVYVCMYVGLCVSNYSSQTTEPICIKIIPANSVWRWLL